MLCKDKICNDDLIDEENSVNLAKLDSGSEWSPTVTVGDKTNKMNSEIIEAEQCHSQIFKIDKSWTRQAINRRLAIQLEKHHSNQLLVRNWINPYILLQV